MKKKIIVCKVGSENRPSGSEDIKEVRESLQKSIDEGIPFVTHHAVQLETIEIDDEVKAGMPDA